jgi:hypothetical protein
MTYLMKIFVDVFLTNFFVFAGDSFVTFLNTNIQKLQVFEFFAVLLCTPRMREVFTKYENKLAISEVAVDGSRPAAIGVIAAYLPKAKRPPFLEALAICCQRLIDVFVNDFVFFKPFLFKELCSSSANIPRPIFSSFPYTSSRGHFHCLSPSSYSPRQR